MAAKKKLKQALKQLENDSSSARKHKDTINNLTKEIQDLKETMSKTESEIICARANIDHAERRRNIAFAKFDEL